MTKQIILEAETIEAIERALKLLESVRDVQILQLPTQKKILESERKTLLERISKGANSINLEEALKELEEVRKDRLLPFRD